MQKNALAILLVLCATSLFAELSTDVRNYERVLIPIAIPVAKVSPTGNWKTAGLISNLAPSPVYVGQGDMHACQVVCSERARMEPDSTTRLYVTPSLALPPETVQNPGAVFFVERPFEDSVVFSNRLTDLSTGKTFTLPSVRERNFAELTHVRLLNVPTGNAVTLRVYDPYDRENMMVDVVFSDPASRQVIASVRLLLRYEWEPAASQDFPMYPAYAVIGDIRALLAQVPDAVQIDVTPTSAEKGIWALASVTSTTGDVMLVYPE